MSYTFVDGTTRVGLLFDWREKKCITVESWGVVLLRTIDFMLHLGLL